LIPADVPSLAPDRFLVHR